MSGLRDWLASQKVSSIVAEREPLVIHSGASPVAAFQMLADAHIRACPVISSDTSTIIGCLDLRDVCKYFVETSSQDGDEANGGSEPNHKEVALLKEEDRAEADDSNGIGPMPNFPHQRKRPSKMLVEIKAHRNLSAPACDIGYLAKMRPMPTFAPEASLLDVLTALTRGSHIAGVMGGPEDQGGIGKVITQGMLFRFICPEIMKLDTKVESVMKSPVLTLNSTEPALSAFKLMAFKGISGVAIVDGTNGEILHSTSSKDLKMWVAGTSEGSNEGQVACARTQSIEEFLVKLRSSLATAKTKSPCSVCHPGDGVGHVAGMLTNTGYHRVWVVTSNEKRAPIGVVSITDMLRLAL